MDTKRYQQIRKTALKRIAARNGQPQPQPAAPNVVRESSDADFVHFDSPEALIEALQKGE